ncbi:L,D-transpeptidase family protein [Planctomycetota bacterium]
MARYSSGLYSRRRKRRRGIVFTVIILLVVVLAVFWLKKDSDQQDDSVISIDVNPDETVEAPVIIPEPIEEKVVVAIKVEPEPMADPNARADELIAEAQSLINTTPTKIIKARMILNDVLGMHINRQQSRTVKAQLGQLAQDWLFSKNIFPQDSLCGSYLVQPGDQLRNIAKMYKVPWEFLLTINNLPRAESLRAGKKIKIVNGPFHAIVHRSTFTMDIYLQKDTFVKTFAIGLGKQSRQTPTGLWVVKPDGKVIKPVWTDTETGRTYYPNDEDYPLGSCWIALKGIEDDAVGQSGFGLHGTNEPNSIGTASSRGCIRLHNGEVMEVYNMLVPGLSQIRIVD